VLVSPEASLPALQMMAFLLCTYAQSFVYVGPFLVFFFCVQISPSYKNTSKTGSRLSLMDFFQLNYLLKELTFKYGSMPGYQEFCMNLEDYKLALKGNNPAHTLILAQ
jgi:hypothetical protein